MRIELMYFMIIYTVNCLSLQTFYINLRRRVSKQNRINSTTKLCASQFSYSRDGNKYSKSNRYNNNYRRSENDVKKENEFDGDHLYGVSPVRLALLSKRRTISELLVQTGMSVQNKKDNKAAMEILMLAKAMNLKTTEYAKHDLNMLADNKPHQGFILRATPLSLTKINELETVDSYRCVLALDEVYDPQNFGALLRTSYFLGCDKIVVCSKNSAPLSPAVSKASSGAMEIMEVHSTDNMMKFLDRSSQNGWQIVGTDLGEGSMELNQLPLAQPTVLVLGNEGHGIRTNVLKRCTHLVKITPNYKNIAFDMVMTEPSTAIIGNDQNPLDSPKLDNNQKRNSILNRRRVSKSIVITPAHDVVDDHESGNELMNSNDYFNQIAQEVDSLNVSVTGGIILHHLLKGRKEA